MDRHTKNIIKRVFIGIIAGVFVAGIACGIYFLNRDYTFNITGADGAEYSYTGQKNVTGEMHGNGTLTLFNGITCAGTWENGKLISDGTLTFPNGSSYVGEMSEKYLPHGTGTFYYIDREKSPIFGENWDWVTDRGLSDDEHNMNTTRKVFYTGMWLDGKHSGYGCVYDMNSDTNVINTWIGEYKKGFMYGEIRKTWKDYHEIIFQFDYDGEEDGNPDDTIDSKENVTFRYLTTDYAPVSGTYEYIKREEITEGIFAGLGEIRGGVRMNGELVSASIYFYSGTDKDGNSVYSYYHGTFYDGGIVGKGEFSYADGTSVEMSNITWLDSQTRNNGTYTGMLVAGEYIGYGIYTWDNGDIYQGEFKNNWINGYGVYKYHDDKIFKEYSGEWIDGVRNGHGTMWYAETDADERDKYTGGWLNGDRHGNDSTLIWKSGAVYTGDYENNLRNGEGKMTFSSGNVYDGSWKAGKENGYGVYTWKDNDTYREYRGDWKDGEYHDDDGLLIYAENNKWNVSQYNGNFVNGTQTGKGIMTWKNGASYNGNWKNGKYDGEGIFTYENGDIYNGSWKDDEYNGIGTFTWANDDTYKEYYGDWKNGIREGEGTMTFTSGNVYKGHWINGQINGYGTFTYLDQTTQSAVWDWVSRSEEIAGYQGKYEGMFSNGMLNGYGIFRHSFYEYPEVSRTIEGEFRNNTVDGTIRLTQTVEKDIIVNNGKHRITNIIQIDEAKNGKFRYTGPIVWPTD